MAQTPITLRQVEQIATARLLGRNTAGSGVIEVLTAATVKTLLSLEGVLTGGGTIATGGSTLTVPATGTAALGTGAANQMTYWSGTNTLTGSANLVVDAAASKITLGTDTNIYRSAANTLKTDDTMIMDVGAVVNESGADVDFRVEGDTNTNLINTDATVDSVGFGIAALTTGALVHAQKTFTNTVNVSGSLYTLGGQAVFNPGTDSAAVIYGIKAYASAYGAGTLSGGVNGIFGQVQNFHTGSLASATALNFSATNNGAGTIGTLGGVSVSIASAASAGAITAANLLNASVSAANDQIITTVKGINFSFSHGTGTSKIDSLYQIYLNAYTSVGTNNYGLYIANLAGATNNYAIKTNAGLVNFGDQAQLVTGSTSLAPLKFTSGGPLTTAAAGMMEFTAERFYLTPTSTARQVVPGVLFTSTADATVDGSASTTETTIIGTGVGSLTLPANFFVAGKTIRLSVRGKHTSSAAPPNLTIKVKLGSTVIGTTGAFADKAGTDEEILILYYITCRTTGSSGTVYGMGENMHHEGTNVADVYGMGNTTTTTINTTTSQVVDCTAQYASTKAGNSITGVICTLEVLN